MKIEMSITKENQFFIWEEKNLIEAVPNSNNCGNNMTAIIIKNTGSRYIPISFNQNLLGVEYRRERIVDGYGNETLTDIPAYSTIVGAWDQTFEAKIVAESELDREEIADIVEGVLMGSRRIELQNNGLFIKSIKSSPSNALL